MNRAAALHLICVGGNAEASVAGGPRSLRQLSSGPGGGHLGSLLTEGAGAKIDISCIYYSWTGAPRDDTWWLPLPGPHWLGARRIETAEIESGALLPANRSDALVIVGWSNGGDTAYNLANRIAKTKPVDVLITLDPVSRLTSYHWLPFNGVFSKPTGVVLWLHAYTKSLGSSWITNPGNIIAAVGGPWNAQPRADVNQMVQGNHGDTVMMLTRLTRSPEYSAFLRNLGRGKG